MNRSRSSRKKRKPSRSSSVNERVRGEIQGTLTILVSILLFLSLYHPGMGFVGALLKEMLGWILGNAAWLIPLGVLVWGTARLLGLQLEQIRPRLLGGLIATTAWATFQQIRLGLDPNFSPEYVQGGGGIVGSAFHALLITSLGELGTQIVLMAAAIVATLLLVNTPFAPLLARLSKKIQTVGKRPRRRTLVSSGGSSSEINRAEKVQIRSYTRNEQLGRTPQAKSGDSSDRETAPGPQRDNEPSQSKETEPQEDPAPVGIEQMSMDFDQYYQLPPTDLLTPGTRSRGMGNQVKGELNRKARLLEETLEAFGIRARISEINHGPTVTRFDLRLVPGVKVSHIVNLADDIALSMATTGVRVVAPVPGKSAVGIEVPNRRVDAVNLREILESQAFTASKSEITIALGTDITGRPLVTNLEDLLHVLIAGSTGSGKSICIRCLIASILYKARPDQVKLLLIDPKVVEFMSYDGLPHLLAPVVTDAKKAAGCLTWAVKEMERRYQHFAESGVRDLPSYNRRAQERGERAMPRIVVIIDELADLMTVARVDVEDAIQRLAQMARAAGIHLIVATQRPSVDVITGVIKANIPSRVAFSVSSSADSRTILDAGGAEKLIGQGDMLFSPVGRDKAIRAQGSFLSDGDLEKLLKYASSQAQPRYRDDVIQAADSGESSTSFDRDADEKLDEAIAIVLEAGEASVSMLQRRLRVGYTRAGRLIDTMEQMGIVGPYQGSKARDVLTTPSQYWQENSEPDDTDEEADLNSQEVEDDR